MVVTKPTPVFTTYWVTIDVVLADVYCINAQPCPKQALACTCLHYKSFENTAGRGEIAPSPTVLATL